MATIATVVSTFIGIVMGLLAGFSTGWLDKVITFVLDVFLSLPFLIVALALAPIIVSRFGDKPDQLEFWQFFALLSALSFFGWMLLARLVRGEVLSLREREFVQAARVIGVPTRRILFKELLPNLIAPIIVSISLGLPAFVTAEAGLAYLGIGVVGTPSWGQTVNKAVALLRHLPPLSLRAGRRHHPPGGRAQPPRRRRSRRLRPQDSPVKSSPVRCIDQPRKVGTPRCA